MTSTAAVLAGSYQVTLPGQFGPAFLATFAAMGVGHAATSSVFLLPERAGQGLADIAAMLQARGLVILGIRRVVEPDTGPSVGPSAGLPETTVPPADPAALGGAAARREAHRPRTKEREER